MTIGTALPVHGLASSRLELYKRWGVAAACHLPTDNNKMEVSGELAIGLLNAAPDAIVIADSRGAIVFANVLVEETFGYAPTELVERPVETLLPRRFRAAHVSHRAKFFESPKPRPMGVGLDLSALHKDGHEFPVEISLSALESQSGLLVMSAIRDITDRKAIERAVTDARDEADRANRAKSAFLAAASHDLRQPLQTLTLLNAAFVRIADPESKLLDIARSQAQALNAMSELLNSLLDISKLEAGAVKPDIDSCLVKNIFERLQAQFSAQAEAKGLRLLVDECDDVVHTDPTLLEQIVQNLIANAIRYTRQGLVQLRCLHHSAFVQIEVVDTGIGIPASELELIFDEFYQAPRQPGQGKEGLGLGLSIVRRLADLLALRLEVDSTPGTGSRFSLNVPRGIHTNSSATPEPARRRVVPAGDRIVLVVDDDDAVANATAVLLETDGYRPFVASGLEEARSRLAEMDGSLDLIICDYHLSPGPTGVETIGKLRETGRRTIPAVLVTGDTSMAVTDMANRLEKCRILSKPIDAAELLAHLQELFE